jgi:DNA-binding NtrC family response regulator
VKLGKPAGVENGRGKIPVLSVSPATSDHGALERLLCRTQWTVYKAETIVSALALLRQLRIPVVVCEANLASDTWKDLYLRVSALQNQPCVIVTSGVADDYLWAEALNMGAYDVLAQPFDSTEVNRSLTLAWLHWRDHHGCAANLSTGATGAAA